MPADLSNVIALQVTSISMKPNGGAQISAEVPDISRYPFPLHLNADQAQVLDGPGEYKVFLVQGRLKDGKDGSWQSDYWYNVFSFNGVVDERNRPTESDEPTEDRQQPTPPKATPTKSGPIAKPTSGRPEYGTQPYWINNSVIFKDGVNLEITRQNNSKETKHDHTIVMENIYWNIKHLADIYYGDHKPSSLVEKAEEMGAKVVEVKPTEEPLFEPEETAMDGIVWDYKKPIALRSRAEFVAYMRNCGWSMEDVSRWLGVKELEDYVSITGNGYMMAAKACKDKALKEGLEPPEDFRQEKK